MTKWKNRSIPRPKLIAAAISAVLFPSVSVFVFWAANLTVNMTSSMPMGIWSIEDVDRARQIPRESIVLFCPPDTELFQRAKTDGILQGGSCKGSYSPLMKQVLGLPGDVIEYTGSFSINGHEVANCKTLAVGFGEFRTPQPLHLVVPKGKLWLMSSHSPMSFDSRYFGLVDRERVLGLASDLLVIHD